jgi:AraC-like DNA-binding protein
MNTKSALPELLLSKNNATGLLPADMMRALIFEREGGVFFIDQYEHEAKTGHIYLVPPGHSYYLNLEITGDVMCVDVPFNHMTPDCKSVMLYCKYMRSKAFVLPNDTTYYQVLDTNLDKGNCHVFCDELLTPLSKAIKPAMGAERSVNQIYMDIVSRYFETFGQCDNIRAINAVTISQALNVHKQTLQRAFRQTLNSTIKDVADQQVISQAVSLLAAPSAHFHSISAIADHLHFYSESDFARYFKNKTGFQPTVFRKHLLERTSLSLLA